MSLDSLRNSLSPEDFASSIDQQSTSLPSTLCLNWSNGGSNASVLQQIVETVGSSVTSLTLNRGDVTDAPEKRQDAVTQADADTLAKLLASLPKLEALELGFGGYAPEGTTYACSLQGASSPDSSSASEAGATVLVYPSSFGKAIGQLSSFTGTGSLDFVLPVILSSVGSKLTQLALGDTVVPTPGQLQQLAQSTGKLERVYLAANVDKDAAKKLVDANSSTLKQNEIAVLNN